VSFAKDVADGMGYWNNVLVPQEQHLICGTYIVILGTTPVSQWLIANIKIINRIEGKARHAADVHLRDGLMVPSKKYAVAIQGLDGQQQVMVQRANLEVPCWRGATPDKFPMETHRELFDLF
jgi:hypothetical protein